MLGTGQANGTCRLKNLAFVILDLYAITFTHCCVLLKIGEGVAIGFAPFLEQNCDPHDSAPTNFSQYIFPAERPRRPLFTQSPMNLNLT